MDGVVLDIDVLGLHRAWPNTLFHPEIPREFSHLTTSRIAGWNKGQDVARSRRLFSGGIAVRYQDLPLEYAI